MPDPVPPVPPAPNPNADPVPPAPTPAPSGLRKYIQPWELLKIILGTLTTGAVSYEMIVPLLQRLATDVDIWVVDPSQRDTVRLALGAVIAILAGIGMTRRYVATNKTRNQILNFEDHREQNGS